MKLIVGLVRNFRVLFALVLLVLGSLGQGLPVHAGMTSDAASMSAMHTMTSMPMDHAAMDGVSDADKAICELQCRALAVALPISPIVLVPVPWVRTAQARAVQLPAPYWSRPDGPPPKHLIL